MYLKLTSIESMAIFGSIDFKKCVFKAPKITDIRTNNVPKIFAFFTNLGLKKLP